MHTVGCLAEREEISLVLEIIQTTFEVVWSFHDSVDALIEKWKHLNFKKSWKCVKITLEKSFSPITSTLNQQQPSA